jgi:hypothetical protein
MHCSKHDWSRWRSPLGLGILLLQVTATAQSQTPVQGHLEKARQLYNDLQYERALEELRSIQTHGLTKNEHVSFLLFKGIFLAELLRMEEASATFKEALVLQPGASLPLDVSPKISIQFEATRAALSLVKPVAPKPPKGPGPRSEPRPPSPEFLQQPTAMAGKPTPSLADTEQADNAAPQEPSQIPPDPLPPIDVEKPERAKEAEAPDPPLPEVALPKGTVGLDRSHALAPHILIPAGTGGVFIIAGGVFWGLARKEYRKLESDDRSLTSFSAVQACASNGRTYQAVGFSLMGAGLVGLGLAAGLYGVDRTDSPVKFSVVTNGRQAVLLGRWR